MPTQEFQHAIWPALLAAQFAQRLRLPPGNMWEPGMVRSIKQHRRDGLTDAEIEQGLRMSLFGER